MAARKGEVLSPLPQEPGYNQRIRAERDEIGYADELRRQREAAKGWQPTQIAILGLVSVVGAVKGTQGIQAMDTGARWTAITAMVLALIAACAGLTLLAASAWPLPRLKARVAAPAEASLVRRITSTRLRAKFGLGATFAALLLLAVAVMTTWLPAENDGKNLVRITTGTSSFCGELRAGSGAAISIGIGTQTIVVPVADIQTIIPEGSCH
jgi:hypothetical protein